MWASGVKIGRWQPVSSGRHAFGLAARRAAPGQTVQALCGVEVSSDELQCIADEVEWICKATCMECWRELAARSSQ